MPLVNIISKVFRAVSKIVMNVPYSVLFFIVEDALLSLDRKGWYPSTHVMTMHGPRMQSHPITL